MIRALVVLALCAPWGVRADTVESHHTDSLGTTFILSLDSAPFPNGRSRYKDDTVVVFVPSYYEASKDGRVDMAVFYHGHFDTALNATEQKRLREQLVKSRKRAWLVVPQLALAAHDSSAGKLELQDGLKALLTSVVTVVRAAPKEALAGAARPKEGASVGTVVVAGHSGGFQGAAFAVSRGGLPIAEVVLFDALYGFSARFARWLAEAPETRKLVHVYRPGPGNRKVTKWTETLRKALSYHKVTLAEHEGGRYVRSEAAAVFIRTEVPHGDVPAIGDLFGECLQDSALRGSR